MVAYRSEADLPDVLEGLRTMSSLSHELHFHDNIGNTKTLTMAWNDLASRGSADYIAFLNTDIRLSPEWDARLVAGIEQHGDSGAVMPRPIGHGWRCLLDQSQKPYSDPATAPAPTREAMVRISEIWKGSKDDYSFGGSCDAAFFVVMVQRSVWETLGGFDERFRFYGQDHDFQRRLLSRFGKYTKIVSCAPVWHRCGGSVREAVKSGDVDFNAEMRHCSHISTSLKSKKLIEWDLLSDAERTQVRLNSEYSKMPTYKNKGRA